MDHKSHTAWSLPETCTSQGYNVPRVQRPMMPFSRFALNRSFPRPSLDACAKFPHALKAGEWLGVDEWLKLAWCRPEIWLKMHEKWEGFRAGFETSGGKGACDESSFIYELLSLVHGVYLYSLRFEVAWTDVGKGYCTVAWRGWRVESSILLTSYSESGFQVCLNGCFWK